MSGDSILSPKHAQYIIQVGPQINSRAANNTKTSTIGGKLNIQDSRMGSSSVLQESQKFMATTTSNYSALHNKLASASNQRSVFDNFNPFTKSMIYLIESFRQSEYECSQFAERCSCPLNSPKFFRPCWCLDLRDSEFNPVDLTCNDIDWKQEQLYLQNYLTLDSFNNLRATAFPR